MQLIHEWNNLALAADPLRGALCRAWTPLVRQDALVPAVAARALDALDWDRTPSHLGRLAPTL